MRPMDDPDAALPFIREILSTLRSNVGGQSTVLGFVGTPWTLAAYAIEGAAERHAPSTLSFCCLKQLLDAPLPYAERRAVFACDDNYMTQTSSIGKVDQHVWKRGESRRAVAEVRPASAAAGTVSKLSG